MNFRRREYLISSRSFTLTLQLAQPTSATRPLGTLRKRKKKRERGVPKAVPIPFPWKKRPLLSPPDLPRVPLDGDASIPEPPRRRAPRLGAAAGRRRRRREPAVLVREAAAEHLEERQADWAYSRPVVALDLLWNLAFITVARGRAGAQGDEDSPMPLRTWVAGYALQPRTGASSGSGRAPERARTGPSAADPATASFPRPRAAGSALRRRRGQIRPPGCGGEARRGGSGGGELAGRASGGGEAELPRF